LGATGDAIGEGPAGAPREATAPDRAAAVRAAHPEQPSGARRDRAGVKRAKAEEHVRAAEKARREGNLLRQLAEADEARRLDPKNRRAVELVGEALVKSGDRARGCPLLRRTRLFAQLGCP